MSELDVPFQPTTTEVYSSPPNDELDGWRQVLGEHRAAINACEKALRAVQAEAKRLHADNERLRAVLEEIADGYERHNPGWWIKKAKAALTEGFTIPDDGIPPTASAVD